MSIKNFEPFLKEIDDFYTRENFLKLKQYIDCLGLSDINQTIINLSSAAQLITAVPKVIDTFDTNVGTSVGDLVIVTGANFVEKFADNANATIPHGVFGIVFTKPTTVRAEVLFLGIKSGLVGLTPGLPGFVSTSGGITQTKPPTGTVQPIGFAIRTTDFFFQLGTPTRQA